MSSKKPTLLSLPPNLQSSNRSESPMLPTLEPKPNFQSSAQSPLSVSTSQHNVLNAVLNLPQTFNNLRTLNNLTKSFTPNGSSSKLDLDHFDQNISSLSKLVKEEQDEQKEEKNGNFIFYF